MINKRLNLKSIYNYGFGLCNKDTVFSGLLQVYFISKIILLNNLVIFLVISKALFQSLCPLFVFMSIFYIFVHHHFSAYRIC